MKANPGFERYLWRVRTDGPILTSVIVEGEIRFGLRRLRVGHRKRTLTRAFSEVLDRLNGILPVTRDCNLQYAEVKDHLWSRGKAMGENDLWIAATALTRELVLVTKDALFENIPRLKVEDWSRD